MSIYIRRESIIIIIISQFPEKNFDWIKKNLIIIVLKQNKFINLKRIKENFLIEIQQEFFLDIFGVNKIFTYLLFEMNPLERLTNLIVSIYTII